MQCVTRVFMGIGVGGKEKGKLGDGQVAGWFGAFGWAQLSSK